ncbi:hypothetical protein EBR04_07420, partial [bacterium]|nr:hypothetical protein [bacterium]
GEGAADNGSFSIDGGVVKTAQAFNFEAKSSYSIRVRSTDQGGLATEKAFTITVTDVAEAPTDIALAGATVAENQARRSARSRPSTPMRATPSPTASWPARERPTTARSRSTAAS